MSLLYLPQLPSSYEEALRSLPALPPNHGSAHPPQEAATCLQGNTIGGNTLFHLAPSHFSRALAGTGRDSAEPMETLPTISPSWALVQNPTGRKLK